MQGYLIAPLPCRSHHQELHFDQLLASLSSPFSRSKQFDKSSKMRSLLSLIPFTTLAASSALQQPLHEAPNSQTPLSSKPLVNSTTLQDHITSDNLLKRAKKLFEIAQLGVAEYNHPTRVIGSDGM
jgi:hypothetical protein